MASLREKVSLQCQDNPYGVNGVVVFGDESYGMTRGYIPDMTGYNLYLRRRNGFSSGVINADGWNDAQASRQMLPMNVAVTVSAISAPMSTRNQLGGRHMDPLFTAGYILQPVYERGGNVSQFWERDEQHEEEEEEKNLHLKEKKKKAGSRKRKRFRHSAAGQVQESFAVNGQMSATARFSTNADALDADSRTFTDGFIAPDDMGDNGHELMNRDEHYEIEKRVHPKRKKKKVKREKGTASPLQRKRIQSASDCSEM